MKPLAAPYTFSHELHQRIRLRSKMLRKRELDPDYFEAALAGIPGVSAVRLNTRAACVVVRYDGLNKTRNAILAYLSNPSQEIFNGRGGFQSLNSILPVVVRGALALSILFLPRLISAPLSLILAAPVLFDGIVIVTLWTRGIKVEVLDAAAVTFCQVRWDLFTAATIVFMFSVGRYLEELSEDKTTGLLKSLLKPQVEKIWIEIDGQEIEIDLADARIGDRVICGAGEMIPLSHIRGYLTKKDCCQQSQPSACLQKRDL